MPSRENSERVAHILGNYEIFEELGRGGMGIVYRGLDLSLDRPVAVKVLRDDLRSQSMIVNRFGREARAAAALDHPNIVQIYTVGDARDVPYIAMEYIDSEPLSALMIREGTLPWQRAFAIASQVASALASAHDAQIIHRDVKPPNILMTPDDKAFVTDFGIAKILSLHDQLTLDGTKLGTPQYMSPERCKTGDASTSSDVYSLGVLLFQMISGRLPHEGATSTELIRRILSQPPARLRAFVPDVPEDIERLVAWLIERRPEHRPVCALEAKEALDRVRAGERFDVSDSAVSRAIAEFRGDTKTSKRRKSSKRRSRKQRTRKPSALRRALALGAAGCAATFMGWAAGALMNGSATETAAAHREVSGWYVSKDAASFLREADHMWIAHLAQPGMRVQNVVWDEANASFLLLTESRNPDNTTPIRRAALAVQPATRTTRAVAPQIEDGSVFADLDWGGRRGAGFVGGTDAFAAVSSDGASGTRSRGAAWFHETLRGIVGESRVSDVVRCAFYAPSGRVMIILREPTGELTVYEQGVNEIPAARATVKGVEAATYSEDGTLYWFATHDEAGTLKVYAGGTAGAAPAELVWQGTGTISSGGMHWSGSRIAVTEPSGTLAYVPLTGPGPERILGEGEAPVWAGDDHIAFLAPDSRGTNQIWVAHTEDEAEPRQLTFLDGGLNAPIAGSRDGKWVAALPKSNDGAAILLVEIETAAH